MELKMQKSSNEKNKPSYQKTSKKEKKTLLVEFIRLTGNHRKSGVHLLHAKPVKQLMLSIDGKLVKVKPEKERPANKKGKRIYTDEVINTLRLDIFLVQMRENPRLAYEAANGLYFPVTDPRHHR
jgi:hypothetical protein